MSVATPIPEHATLTAAVVRELEATALAAVATNPQAAVWWATLASEIRTSVREAGAP